MLFCGSVGSQFNLSNPFSKHSRGRIPYVRVPNHSQKNRKLYKQKKKKKKKRPWKVIWLVLLQFFVYDSKRKSFLVSLRVEIKWQFYYYDVDEIRSIKIIRHQFATFMYLSELSPNLEFIYKKGHL